MEGVADAGSALDAGRDAGQSVSDAGVAMDAGQSTVEPYDAGPPPPTKEETRVPPTNKLKPGCGCQGSTPGILALVTLVGFALRTRRRS